MKKRKIKNKAKNRFLRILLIVLITIIILVLLVIILNLILRKEVSLSNNQIENLNKIFPKEHIKDIRLYEKGLFSIGSTKTIYKSIYFENTGLGKYFFENPDSNKSIILLVHETVHTYQSRNSFGCIKMSILSLCSQFIAYLKYGSRNYAYYYRIDSDTNLNPEQEASIIEDYFNLKFVNGDTSGINCINCENYEKPKLIEKLEIRTKNILNKYNYMQ